MPADYLDKGLGYYDIFYLDKGLGIMIFFIWTKLLGIIISVQCKFCDPIWVWVTNWLFAFAVSFWAEVCLASVWALQSSSRLRLMEKAAVWALHQVQKEMTANCICQTPPGLALNGKWSYARNSVTWNLFFPSPLLQLLTKHAGNYSCEIGPFFLLGICGFWNWLSLSAIAFRSRRARTSGRR